MKPLEPGKKLRFTRSRQALLFWLAAAMILACAVVLFATSRYRFANPALPHPGWAMIPLAVGCALAALAMRLTKHAYLIVTPLGIEIFPFFRPALGMQLIVWSEIHSAEVDARHSRLTLHRDAAHSSGIHLSLAPIDPRKRDLLARAVLSRLERKV